VSRLALLLVLALALPAAAQEKKPAKKPAAKPVAHGKPTPQQIRRFNELEKRQPKEKKK
jgi:hypothetical protein